MEPTSDPLAQLRDIHLPPEVGYWPLSFGWWVVIIVLVGFILLLAIWFYRKWKKGLAKRLAIAHLDTIYAQSDQWHIELNTLLKRAALSYFDASIVASLHSDAWTSFMASHLPNSKKAEFIKTFSKLQASLYSGKSAVDFENAKKQTGIWLKHALPAKSEPSHV